MAPPVLPRSNRAILVAKKLRCKCQRQVSFRSLSDGAIDTTTASGELVFHIFSALARFERRLIQERTRAGLTAARARGKHGGRQALQPEEPRVRMAYTMYADRRLTVRDICRTLRISQATSYRYVALGRRAADSLGHTPEERGLKGYRLSAMSPMRSKSPGNLGPGHI